MLTPGYWSLISNILVKYLLGVDGLEDLAKLVDL